MTKVCTECGIEKPISEYYRHKQLADGSYAYKAKCKACVEKVKRRWRDAHTEQVRDYKRQWDEQNKSKLSENSKRRWEKKRGPLVERQCKNEKCGKLFQARGAKQKYCSVECGRKVVKRTYERKQRGPAKPKPTAKTCKVCGQTKGIADFAAHRNVCLQCLPKWRAARHQQYKAYYKEQTRKRKMRRQNAEGFHTDAEWEALKAKYNHTCLRCGQREPTITLTRDHVKPLILGGTDYIGNIQPLCHSCNSQKNDTEIDYRPHHTTPYQNYIEGSFVQIF